MDILSDKIVTTRKVHFCGACGRKVEKGEQMRAQVNTYDGIGVWRACLICDELLEKHWKYFADEYNECTINCVSEALEANQTPEDLLKELNEKAKIHIN